jgi:ring-1,2-phenylacetyl-CoA epoxidase subunit PaaE
MTTQLDDAPMAPAGFARLPVAALDALTEDAVAITFAIPADLRTAYAWAPGQHVAIAVPGDAVRRSYSICSLPRQTGLRIGVRRIPGGGFSDRTLGALRVGDDLDVTAPAGRFGAALPGLRRPVFVAAGSGVTPVLAMAGAALADPAVDEVSVVVANRSQASVMFLDDLAGLKDAHPDRFTLVHVLTREQQESPLLSGRLDATRFDEVRCRLLGPADGWFVCGPQPWVVAIRDALAADGVARSRVHVELFHADAPPPAAVATTARGAVADVRLAGRSAQVTVEPGEAVLDALLRVRPDAPYACKGGVCGTCRARVLDGEVAQAATWALEPAEVEAGFVLTCQTRPISDRVSLDYDA